PVREIVAEEPAWILDGRPVGGEGDAGREGAEPLELCEVRPQVSIHRIDDDGAFAGHHVADHGHAERRFEEAQVTVSVPRRVQAAPELWLRARERELLAVHEVARDGRVDARGRVGMRPERETELAREEV